MFIKSIDTGSIKVEISILNTKVKWKRKGIKTSSPWETSYMADYTHDFPCVSMREKLTLGGIVYSECTTTL